MAINIKSAEVCSLIQEAAELSGTSQVSAIEAAMRDYLVRLRQEGRRSRALEVLVDIDRTLTDSDRAAIRADLDDLYDEDGLPS